MKLQIGVKVLIRNSQGAYLLLRRTKLLASDTNETSWDIPGGRIEPEEQLIEALKREVKEEVGHDMKATPLLVAAQDILVPKKELHVVRLTYVLDDDVADITLSDEHDAYQWVQKTDLGSVNTEPYLAEVLTSL